LTSGEQNGGGGCSNPDFAGKRAVWGRKRTPQRGRGGDLPSPSSKRERRSPETPKKHLKRKITDRPRGVGGGGSAEKGRRGGRDYGV